MGSRVSYCVKDEKGREPIYFRQQWMSSIEQMCIDMKRHLGQFFRFDMGAGRALNAMIVTNGGDSDNISSRIWDSADNGLIEVDVSQFDKWIITHYDIDWETQIPEKKGIKIAEFDKNGFHWVIDENKRKSLGEGLY